MIRVSQEERSSHSLPETHPRNDPTSTQEEEYDFKRQLKNQLSFSPIIITPKIIHNHHSQTGRIIGGSYKKRRIQQDTTDISFIPKGEVLLFSSCNFPKVISSLSAYHHHPIIDYSITSSSQTFPQETERQRIITAHYPRRPSPLITITSTTTVSK